MEYNNQREKPNSPKPLMIYRNVKVRFNSLMERVIKLCNSMLVFEEEAGQPVARRIILRMVRFIGSLALLLQQFPRAEAFDINDPDGRVVYIGTAYGADAFQELYNNSHDLQPKTLGRFKVWELSDLAMKWLSSGVQMVVCEFSPLFPFRFDAAFVISSPGLIEQEVFLPDNLVDLYNQPNFRVIRRKLNRSQRRSEFKSYFTRESSDFDLYYHKMYVPYITKRHGKVAVVSSYDGALENFKRGGLVMIREGQKPVAGMLVVSKSQICFYLETGILDGDEGLIRKDVHTFNLWSVIEWANKQGSTRLNMGAGPAWRSNGVFNYKRNWGAFVRRFKPTQSNLFYLMENPSEEFLEKINKKGIITEVGGNFLGVILAQSNSKVDEHVLENELKEAVADGLSGVLVVSPDSRVQYHANG